MRWFRHKDADENHIDFQSPDWFDQYIALRKTHPVVPDIPDPAQLGFSETAPQGAGSWGNPLYSLLLHSGLIYGFPFLYPFKPAPPDKPGTRWATKLLLIDTILYGGLEKQTGLQPNSTAYSQALDQVALHIRGYYQGIMQAHNGESGHSIEYLLGHRVTFYRNWLDWRKSGINTHLFWDWYFFIQYLDIVAQGHQLGQEDFKKLLERKKAMKWLTMQFIIAAAHCDSQIKRRERVLQHHFEKSSHFFTPREIERLQVLFRDGLKLAHLQVPDLNWTARRYLLDISLLVVYADREIHESEDAYLHELLAKLDLQEQDLIESQLALGGFLLRFGQKIPFLSGRKSSLALIGRALTHNLHKMRKATGAEVTETRDMALTLGRLLQHQLGINKSQGLPSEEEIAAAFDQIKDLPKFLPFFSLVFFPVPGITEMYILLAYSIERLSGETIRLLPSNFSKMVKGK
ncbi:MAG: hypothetical protein ACOYOO_14215 [Saprospiraceae bacterium]